MQKRITLILVWVGLLCQPSMGQVPPPVDAVAAQYRSLLRALAGRQFSTALSLGEQLLSHADRYPLIYERIVQVGKASGLEAPVQQMFNARLKGDVPDARGYYGLGLLAKARGDSQAALGYFQQSVREMPDFAPALMALVDAYRAIGKSAAAEVFFQQTLSSTTHSAYKHFALGYLFARDRQPVKALSELDVATALMPFLKDVCYVKGLALQLGGQLAKALAICQECYSRLEPTLNEDEKQAFVNLIASVYLDDGRLVEAEQYFRDGLRWAQDLGDEGYEEASLAYLGRVAELRSSYAQALLYYQEAYAKAKVNTSFNSRINLPRYPGRIGSIYLALGDYVTARHYFEQGVALAKAARNERLEAAQLAYLGDALIAAQQLEEALVCYQRVVELNRKVPDAFTSSASADSLSFLYLKKGEYQKALELVEEGLKQARAIAYFDRELILLNRAGELLGRLGWAERAAESYQQALQLATEKNSPQQAWTACAGLAALYQRTGRAEQAREFFLRALQLMEATRAHLGAPEDRMGFLQDKLSLYRDAVRALHTLHLQLPASGYDREAFLIAEQGRARALLDELAAAQINETTAWDEAARGDYKKRNARVVELQLGLLKEQARTRPDPAAIRGLEAELERVALEQSNTQRAARQHLRDSFTGLEAKPIAARDLQAGLDAQTAFLQYQMLNDAVLLFVFTKERFEVFLLPDLAGLRQRVASVRETISTPGAGKLALYRVQAAALYRDLVAPARALLAGKKNLVVVADDVLQRLPFEVLLTAAAPATALGELPYLLRQFTISYAPSASVWTLLQQRQPTTQARKDLMALGDPDYGNEPAKESQALAIATRSAWGGESLGKLARLPYSRREVESVARLFPAAQVTMLMGKDANEAKTKSTLSLADYRMLHFAAHGLLNESKPQFSGLVLALSPESKAGTPPADDATREDGLLQAYEIYNLKLNADLVVLSACETGLGKMVNGEGMIGLTRAFFYAGTPTVVASLWKVADDSTATLMEHFYRNLRDGKVSKAEALRQAQLALVRANKSPYFWAAFVLQGKA